MAPGRPGNSAASIIVRPGSFSIQPRRGAVLRALIGFPAGAMSTARRKQSAQLWRRFSGVARNDLRSRVRYPDLQCLSPRLLALRDNGRNWAGSTRGLSGGAATGVTVRATRRWARCPCCARRDGHRRARRPATRPGPILRGQGPPELARSTRQSHDTAIQRRLRAVSQELTGVTFPVGPGPAEGSRHRDAATPGRPSVRRGWPSPRVWWPSVGRCAHDISISARPDGCSQRGPQ